MVLSAQSLWKPGFPGYAAESGGYEPGDIVSVIIDASTVLSLDSVQKSSDSTRISFTGGSAGELVSFLPSAQAGQDSSLEASNDLSLQTRLTVRIQSVDEFGDYLVSGRRQISVDGRLEEISLRGTVSPEKIVDGTLLFGDLADAVLSYTGVLSQNRELIQPGDILYPPNDEDPEGADSGALSPERRRELVRVLMNRFLQQLF